MRIQNFFSHWGVGGLGGGINLLAGRGGGEINLLAGGGGVRGIILIAGMGGGGIGGLLSVILPEIYNFHFFR